MRTTEELNNYINIYKEDLNRISEHWYEKDSKYTKSDLIDALNVTHTAFTKCIDDMWIDNDISTEQWENLQLLAFKEYRKAVHTII